MRTAPLRVFVFAALALVAGPTRADLVTLASGEEIVGEILKQDKKKLTVRTAEGKRTIPRKDVRTIQSDGDLREIHRDRLARLRSITPEELHELARWLERVGLQGDARVQLEQIVTLAPDDPAAREGLGHEKTNGRWVLPRSDRGRSPGSQDPSLPEEAETLLPLTLEHDPWFRWVGYKRLRDLIEERRFWLQESLSDPDSPGYAVASDELGWAPPTESGLDEQLEKELRARIETLVRTTLIEPLGERLRPRRSELVGGLRNTFEKIQRSLPSMSNESRRKKEIILQRWEQERQAALEFIQDSAQYYKIEQKGKGTGKSADLEKVVGQEIVDEKVDAVREIWKVLSRMVERDAAQLERLSPRKARALLEDLSRREFIVAETKEFLVDLGFEVGEELQDLPVTARCFLHYRAEDFGPAWELQETLPPWERVLFARLRDIRVLKANQIAVKSRPPSGLSPTAAELKQSAILNSYRMMLGVSALEVHPNLTEAARGHSAEMSRLGYFAHESPTPGRETPTDRANLAGYEDSVGENIFFGEGGVTPQEAHDWWYTSPGHHRNMVHEDWLCIGVGYFDGHFTQNFGDQRIIER